MSKNNSGINISGSEKTWPFFCLEKIVRNHCILMNLEEHKRFGGCLASENAEINHIFQKLYLSKIDLILFSIDPQQKEGQGN